MRKTLRNQNLNERPRARTLLALSLVASLAAFGCTTNSMRGAGDRWMGLPGVGPSSPSAISGTSVPTMPPPMTSSYTREEARSVKPMRSYMLPLSAAEAAAIMAQHQPRVRVLGPVDPGPSTRPYVSDGMVTGQVSPPAIRQYTINSSINNPQPGSAFASGVGAGGVTSDDGAAVFTQNLTTLTPTVLGAAVPPTTTTNAASVSTGAGTVNTNTARAAANGDVRVVTTSGKVVVTNSRSQ